MSTEVELESVRGRSLDDSPDSIKARDATKQLALLFHDKQTELTRAEEKIKRLEAALEASEERIATASQHRPATQGGPPSAAPRKVIEDLTKENARLQGALRDAKSNAANGEDWVLVTGELRRENSNLRSQLKTTKTALDSLNIDDTRPAAEIVRLSEKLGELEEQLKVKNALVEGLSTNLAETQKRVERLESELREANASTIGSDPDTVGTHLRAEVETANKKLRQHESTISNLQSLLQQTQLEKSQAIEVTHNWDAYCKEQEKLLRSVKEKCANLEGQITKLEAGKESRKRDVERILLSAKQLVDKERKDRLRAQAATKKAQEQFEMLEGKYRLLEHNFKKESDQRSALEEERRVERERTSLMEQQVKLYKDDFEKERRVHERIASELDAANSQLKEFRRRNRVLEDERRHMEPRRLQSGSGGGAVANYPLSSYEHQMVLQHQQRIENQIKRDRQRRMPSPPDDESDLVPRSLTQHLGPNPGDVQADSTSADDGRIFTSLTTHSQPITQPTADSDEEQMSVFGGSRSVVVPAAKRNAASAPPLSVPRMGSLSAGPPRESMKNSQPPQRKGRGSELVCPRCSAAFPARSGAEYIEHVDKCCSLND